VQPAAQLHVSETVTVTQEAAAENQLIVDLDLVEHPERAAGLDHLSDLVQISNLNYVVVFGQTDPLSQVMDSGLTAAHPDPIKDSANLQMLEIFGFQTVVGRAQQLAAQPALVVDRLDCFPVRLRRPVVCFAVVRYCLDYVFGQVTIFLYTFPSPA